MTSVAWMADGIHLAIGTSTNEIQMWNVEESKRVRTMGGSHTMRIGALAWNEHILSSGSRDSTIVHHDVRVARHETAVLRGGAAGGHTQEICGLKWSPDGRQLASGGNDNVVCIWDADKVSPKFVFTESQAAVKALAWCPFQQHLLATGASRRRACSAVALVRADARCAGRCGVRVRRWRYGGPAHSVLQHRQRSAGARAGQ